MNPGVPEVMQKQELKKLAKTYGKFWCTWQFDRGTISSPHNDFGLKVFMNFKMLLAAKKNSG